MVAITLSSYLARNGVSGQVSGNSTSQRRNAMPRKKANPPKSRPLENAPDVPSSIQSQLYAVEYWERITPGLVKIEALTNLHLESLESLCRWWHVYRCQCDWLEENPDAEFVTTDKGYVMAHPRITLRQKAYDNLTKLWPKFGLTPRGLAELQSGTGGNTGITGAPLLGPKIANFAAQKTG